MCHDIRRWLRSIPDRFKPASLIIEDLFVGQWVHGEQVFDLVTETLDRESLPQHLLFNISLLDRLANVFQSTLDQQLCVLA